MEARHFLIYTVLLFMGQRLLLLTRRLYKWRPLLNKKEKRTEPKQLSCCGRRRILRVAFFSNAVGRGVRSRSEHAKGRTELLCRRENLAEKGSELEKR
jgi:hypothetical protein